MNKRIVVYDDDDGAIGALFRDRSYAVTRDGKFVPLSTANTPSWHWRQVAKKRPALVVIGGVKRSGLCSVCTKKLSCLRNKQLFCDLDDVRDQIIGVRRADIDPPPPAPWPVDLGPLVSRSLLSAYLGLGPQVLGRLANGMSGATRHFDLVTNAGKKTRRITAADGELGHVHDRIRHVLFSRVEWPDCVHGFVPGRGTVSNALAHVGDRAWVMNIDLANFFPGIGMDMVRDVFGQVFGCHPAVSPLLTRLVTFSGSLPTGFSTSPDIANMAARGLDARLMTMANDAGVVYTRYADDLTFSSADNSVPADEIRDLVAAVVADEGFRVNWRKFTVMRRGRRQKVTGLVVSATGVSVPRSKRRVLRAACHRWRDQSPERKRQIWGWISYVNASDPGLAARLAASTATDVGVRGNKPVPVGDFAEDR